MRDRYRTVKPEDVQRVALAYLKRSNVTIGEFLPDPKPDRAPVPATVDVAAMVKDYKGDATATAGEAFDPSPANLDARTQRFALPNGMKVALLPKKTRGETVSFNLSLHFGDEKSVFGKASVGALTGSMLNRGTATEVAAGDRGRVRQAAREGRASAARRPAPPPPGQTYRAQLADTLRLTAEVLREPSFPASELDHAQAPARDPARSRRAPIRRASRSARSRATTIRIRPGDPRYAPTVEESIANNNAVTLDDVKRFHRAASTARATPSSRSSATSTPTRCARSSRELFGDWKSPSAVHPRARSVPSEQAGGAAPRRCRTRPTRSSSAASASR